MENLFNFDRFWLLVRKYANVIRKMNFISVFVIFIPAIIMHLTSFNNMSDGVFLFFVFFLVLIGWLYTDMLFKGWTDKAIGASTLTLPATALEKIAVVLFYTVFVFIPAYTFAFYISHLGISKIFHPGITFSFIGQYRGLSTLPALILYAFLPYMFFHSLFLLFSVGITKKQAGRVIIILIAIVFIVTSIWNMFYLKWLTGMNNGPANVLKQYVFFPTVVEYTNSNTQITSLLITDISIGVIAISTLLFYIASYLKLKEKEI